MKKLMMMAAVACAASMASAASLYWRPATSAYTVDGVTASGNAVILVLKTGDDVSVSWENGKMKVTGGVVVGHSTLGADGKNTTSLHSNTFDEWGKGTLTAINGTETWVTDFNPHDYVEVIFDSATISDSSKWQVGASKTSQMASKPANDVTMNMSGAALKSENWTNIPEPCTVALLALGMGALALRRKQR